MTRSNSGPSATNSSATSPWTRSASSRSRLQVELLKFPASAADSGTQHVLLFEGRDAAGKGGTIKRFMEHLNPRYARTVAVGKPSDREQGQWYFQRYVQHLPTEGEMVLFDRSWYNRAGVERVMGFVPEPAYDRSIARAPLVERMLVDSGGKDTGVVGSPDPKIVQRGIDAVGD